MMESGNYTVLYCTVLYCPVLPCIAVPCPALLCSALPCSDLPCSALPCAALCCTVTHGTILYITIPYYCIVLYCTALYCITLQWREAKQVSLWRLSLVKRELNALARFSASFENKDNFCGFLFVFLHTKPLLKKVHSKRNDFAHVWSKFIPFGEAIFFFFFLFQKEDDSSFDRVATHSPVSLFIPAEEKQLKTFSSRAPVDPKIFLFCLSRKLNKIFCFRLFVYLNVVPSAGRGQVQQANYHILFWFIWVKVLLHLFLSPRLP